MRIAHVVSTYPPYKGGMGNVAYELVERQKRRGHDVTVLTPSTLRPWLRYGNAALMPQLSWKLGGYDVVHLHWPFIGGAEFVLLAKCLGLIRGNVVVTYHMDLVGSGALAVFFRMYQRVLMPLTLKTATFVTVASLDYAGHSRWLRGRRYLVEIPFGVDTQRFNDDSPIRANRRMVDAPVALFVAALDRAHYFKGLHVLFSAWKELGVQTRARARLRIVGEGDMRTHYEQQARELGIADSVEFLGAVPWKELPAMYQSADFLVSPSVDASEAFGLVILEAMASGLPAIVSNLPGVRTLVAEGQTGLLTAPGNIHELAHALRKFIADSESREHMGVAARARVLKTYSWEATVDAVEWTYRLKSNPIDKLALIAIKDRRVLMTMSRGKDLWYLPGGKRDQGESDRECLVREIKEELSLALEPSSIDYYGTFEAHAHGKPLGIAVRTTCYRASYSGAPKASGEIEKVAFLGYGQKLETATVAHLVFDDLKNRNLIN